MDFAVAWRCWPAIAAYRAAADVAHDADAAEAAVATLLRQDCWPAATVAALAALFREDPQAAPFAAFGGGTQQGLVLIDDPVATIALAAIPADRLAARKVAGAGRGGIAFEGAVSLYRVLHGGGATLAWWEAPAIDDGFDAGTRPRCMWRENTSLSDGDLLRVDGRRETFIVERATRDIVWVQALVKSGRKPVRVEYDAVSHGCTGASAGDAAASHAEMRIALLASTGRHDAVPAIRRWLDDPRFFLRWSAARALVALDPAQGAAALAKLADDPHRDVADAARTALARATARAAA